MIISTTPTLEGRTIAEYRGLVTGEAILGANIFKDLFAGIRDIVGGRSGAYEQELAKARTIAIQGDDRGPRLSAPTPWWVSTSTTRRSARAASMLMVTASGTAVRLG